MKRRLGFAVSLGLMLLIVAMMSLSMIGMGAKPAQAAPLASGGTRSVLTVATIVRTPGGLEKTLYSADGDGHKFLNDQETFVEIQNNYTATVTATFVTQATRDGLAISDLDIAISASTNKLVGPFPVLLYNNLSGSDKGYVYINYSAAVTGSVANSVTVGAFRF